MPPYEIITADVLEWAASYQGPPFHAILCDPPYHLTTITNRFGKEGSAPAKGGVYERSSRGFMGQTWDGGDIAFRSETWAAFLPLLHPGAFGMAFASARGWHRMAVAIEDAGFLIHPSIFGWVYASGFPKATRIDTQIDRVRPGYFDAIRDYVRERIETSRLTPWVGHRYGSQALKPALEPIILFQKPYDSRPIETITATGAGALNIDGGRIGAEVHVVHGKEPGAFEPVSGRWPANFALSHSPECVLVGTDRVKGSRIDKPSEHIFQSFADGGLTGPRPARGVGDEDGLETVERWACVPSCPVRRLDDQTGELTSGQGPVMRQQDGGYNKGWPMGQQAAIYGDSGPASRFFLAAGWADEIEEAIQRADPVHYQAKADREERERGLRFLLPCIKCGSYDSLTHKTESGVEVDCRRDPHPCLAPGTLVVTAEGLRPIDSIQVGDRVYAADGQFRPVYHVSSHNHDGVLNRIRVAGLPDETGATDNHPFLSWIPRRHHGRLVGGRLQWTEASGLQIGDYLVNPVPQRVRRPTQVRTRRAAYWWAMGLWAAEGSLQVAGHGKNRYPVWSLHSEDERSVRQLTGLFRRISVYPSNNGRAVHIMAFDPAFGKDAARMCGVGAARKRLAAEVLSLPRPLLRAFLEGYLHGDGHVTRGESRATTVSRDLAYGLYLASARLDIKCSIALERPPKKPTVIQGRTIKHRSDVYRLTFSRRRKEGRKHSRPQWWAEPDGGQTYMLHRITAIHREAHVGRVWNLSVRGSPTFATAVGASHNTVKPIALARWLATLLLPPDAYAPRRLFVPFAGVGSEMIGAKQAGWEEVVGVELHEEYVRVGIPRLAAHIGMF